ncbi:MAG TPA: beta-galactosidase [Chthonomonadales bacterium]|nr:beta-galactosidase [Chthonomonadales bacterium]
MCVQCTRREFLEVGVVAGGVVGGVTLAGAAGTPAIAGLTVRVESRNGAPRLLVNGEPVRGRMFWGGPGPGTVPVGSDARLVTFEFIASADAPNGTLHVRFGQKPGNVWLDDVSVVDVETGADVMPLRNFEQGADAFGAHWFVWPPGAANTVGRTEVQAGAGRAGSAALRVTLTPQPDGRWPDYHIYHVQNLRLVSGRSYRVSFWSRAEPARDLSVNLFRPAEPFFIHLGGPPSRFESQIRLAAGAGIDFVSFPIPTPWPEPGQPEDWTPVDAAVERVLRANPRALLIPRFSLDPPPWWVRARPGDVMRWEDGSTQAYGVPASPRYRRDAATRAYALVRHLEERYPDRIAGYHPCGQNTAEWFYQDTWGDKLNGYADADREGWRTWLRNRYRDDASLRLAWRDPTAKIDAAEVPTPAQRREAPNGVLRDPGSERHLVDFAAYQQDAMADLVLEVAAATRRASQGRKLVVIFYGYGFEFGGVLLGPATSGHYALRRILQSPDIDILCSPVSYGDRAFGQTGPVMSAAESVALAGKLWLQEDDTRTHLSPEDDPHSRNATLDQTRNVLARNMANEATRNMASWWMDLGMVGWFDDPDLWRLMRRLEPLDRPFLERAIPFRPQVAAVLDEASHLLVAPWAQEVTGPIVHQGRWALGRMGAPYGQYLLDDVVAGRVGARLFVFLNAWRMSPDRRAALARATRGQARVWCYAPGAFNEQGPSPEGMRALTGFRLERVVPAEAWATPTEAGRRAGLTTAFGLRRPVQPLFAATDAARGEVLANYPDGSAAVAMRRGPTGVDIFVGAPALTPEVVRLAARAGGVRLMADRDALVHANGPIVAVTATQDGTVALDVGRAVPVMDALSGARVGRGPRLALRLRRGETRVLRLGPPATATPAGGRRAPAR